MKSKDKLTTKMENERFRQGRSKEQVESSYFGATIAIAGSIILLILVIIFS
jgi:hypothetical protein|tara:strand:+ start:1170 stop:1322 length:153 start_codon:yes stop_codon:yes gene_type:complete